MTQVSIAGTEFLLDGTPTYVGREFEGHPIQGLLLNLRAVQATFDDASPETRRHWVYPDSREWNADRNVGEFCDALPAWRDHGVLAFTVNFQGGGALYTPEVYEAFDNNGFTREGSLKPPYADRIGRVLARADELGMVAIVGLFYGVHLAKLADERAVWRAAREALEFLAGTGRHNVLVELANEVEACVSRAGYDAFRPEKVHEMLGQLQADFPDQLFSTSQVGANAETGQGMPPPSLVATVDYVLLHGNGTRAAQLEAAIQTVQAMEAYRDHPKPIVINEDSPGIPNLDAAWRNGASWGYFDQGFGGPAAWAGDAYVDYRSHPREARYEDLSGFQTPPVNWTINTALKRVFFDRVAEVTGASGRGAGADRAA